MLNHNLTSSGILANKSLHLEDLMFSVIIELRRSKILLSFRHNQIKSFQFNRTENKHQSFIIYWSSNTRFLAGEKSEPSGELAQAWYIKFAIWSRAAWMQRLQMTLKANQTWQNRDTASSLTGLFFKRLIMPVILPSSSRHPPWTLSFSFVSIILLIYYCFLLFSFALSCLVSLLTISENYSELTKSSFLLKKEPKLWRQVHFQPFTSSLINLVYHHHSSFRPVW